MGADIKALRGRIKSVDSTLHLTTAMGLVASSKIRRAAEAARRAREYERAIGEAVQLLCASPACEKSVYRQTREQGRDCVIVIAGDRGLAGGYNANVFRLCRELTETDFVPIGKRACDRFGDGILSSEHLTPEEAAGLSERLCRAFCDGEYRRIGIVRTRYVSMLSQETVLEWILPLEKTEKKSADIVFEPDERAVLEPTVKTYVTGVIVGAVRESFLSEVAARRTAMDSAGKNAQEMIEDLQLQYNRARQGAITQEITEIVAGSGV